MGRNIITECPACTTRFQVTQGQLKIANGKVRCGSCLEIFNAEVYRCDDLNSPLEELEQTNNDIRQKDPLFDRIEVPAFAPPQRSPIGFDKRYIAPAQAEPEAEPLNSSPFDDDSNELEQPIQELINAEIITDQGSVTEQTAIEFNTNESVTETTEQIAPPEADEIEPEKGQPLSINTDTNAEITPQTLSTESEDTEQDLTALLSEHSITEPAENIAAPPSKTVSVTPPSISSFQPEPVMIRATQEESTAWSGWTIYALLALVLLATQYLWFNRQQLSTYPELTPGYKLACEHLPCELKAPVNLDLLNTRKLVIQQHAEYQGALSVTLLLDNLANINQPFPAIQLAFSDRKGQLISQRIFQPVEYLNATQGESMNIAAGQAVQINFDILDPGRRALSYEVRLKVPAADY